VISREVLNAARSNLPLLELGTVGTVGDMIIRSHLEALDEIARLRSALKTVLSTLDAVDYGNFDEAIEGVVEAGRPALQRNC
jgi:hypothetical protein